MLKTQKALFECNRSTFITAAMLIILARCSASSIIRANEGNMVQLNFSYPCDSTKVTLQHGYKSPFYSSANPEAISLPQNHAFENRNETEGGTCSLHLTINPVLRDDEGTYILTAYKNGQMLPDYPRIGLRVKHLPGKASCETSNEYSDDEWVSLQCTAPAGNIAGQIVCYQNGTRLPELTTPEETGGTLRQSILARSITDPVNCCSSSLEQTLDMCQCKDYGWDPIRKKALDVIDPCPVRLPTTHFTSSQTPNEELTDSINSSLITDISRSTPPPLIKHPINIHVHVYLLAVINCIFTCVGLPILVVLSICNIRQTKQLSMLAKRKCSCDSHLKLLQSTHDHEVQV